MKSASVDSLCDSEPHTCPLSLSLALASLLLKHLPWLPFAHRIKPMLGLWENPRSAWVLTVTWRDRQGPGLRETRPLHLATPTKLGPKLPLLALGEAGAKIIAQFFVLFCFVFLGTAKGGVWDQGGSQARRQRVTEGPRSAAPPAAKVRPRRAGSAPASCAALRRRAGCGSAAA